MSKKQSKAKAYTALLEDEALEDAIDGGIDEDMSVTEEERPSISQPGGPKPEEERPSVPMTPLEPANPIKPEEEEEAEDTLSTDDVRVGEEVNGTFCKVYLVKDMDVNSFDHTITGTVIAGQTDASLSRSKEVREIFHKDCNGNAKKSGGKNSWSLSLSGMVIFGDEGLELVEEIYDGDGSCGVYIEMGNRRYYGKAILVQNDMALPNDSEVTYDINVEGSGKLYKVDKGAKVKFALPKSR